MLLLQTAVWLGVLSEWILHAVSCRYQLLLGFG